ncbi:hypothetical protein T09_12182 [Trichinella sp. T9]|nr:hypothetical protein T09_12182 [Trichinella sp. T9]
MDAGTGGFVDFAGFYSLKHYRHYLRKYDNKWLVVPEGENIQRVANMQFCVLCCLNQVFCELCSVKLVKLFGKQLLFCSNEKTIPVPFYQYPNSAAFKQLMMYAIINRGWGTAALLLSKVESDIVCDKLMQWRRCNQAKNKKDRKRNLEEEIENFPLTVLMKIFDTSICFSFSSSNMKPINYFDT